MGMLMVWFDQFIPATPSNLEKLVIVSDGIGRPAPMAVAAAAFGEPQLKFKGGAESFKTNLGAGGAFSKVGTLTNFNPTPSVNLD